VDGEVKMPVVQIELADFEDQIKFKSSQVYEL